MDAILEQFVKVDATDYLDQNRTMTKRTRERTAALLASSGTEVATRYTTLMVAQQGLEDDSDSDDDGGSDDVDFLSD